MDIDELSLTPQHKTRQAPYMEKAGNVERERPFRKGSREDL